MNRDMRKFYGPLVTIPVLVVLVVFLVGACTQEQQNKISREIQNYTGTNGVLDVMSGGKLMYRFIKIDKLTTADATGPGNYQRDYRFGYGHLDKNLNYQVDEGELKVYFEVSNYSTEYLFYENPTE